MLELQVSDRVGLVDPELLAHIMTMGGSTVLLSTGLLAPWQIVDRALVVQLHCSKGLFLEEVRWMSMRYFLDLLVLVPLLHLPTLVGLPIQVQVLLH